MLPFAVRSADDRASAPARPEPSGDPLGTALRWPADWVVELLEGAEQTERPPLPWGYDAWFDPGYTKWLRGLEESEDGTDAHLPTKGMLISVLVPVYRPKLWYFRACVDSIRAQSYESWELCLCDDASGDPELSELLNEMAGEDRRIKVVHRRENGGISRATNDALAVAIGEFVALLDHDDVIQRDALAEIVAAIDRDTDVLYTDEDKIRGGEKPLETPRLSNPHLKPDWAPELLLTYPYLGHFLVLRRALLQEIGGFRPDFDGSQDYDVMLRATEHARSVVHLPKVLYHWRAVEGSASDDATAKPWAHAASRRVLEDALQRRGVDAVVEDGYGPGWYDVRRPIKGSPSVTVIIPFRDEPAMTAQCLRSLAVAPGYENFEVVLVDNGSAEPETRALRDRWQRQGIRIFDYPEPFNWSVMNNIAASRSDADLLLFMNNDIEARKPGWLHALVELAQRDDVGAVGARLLYPDGIIQHAGVTLGLGGIAAHLFAGLPRGLVGYMSWDRVVRPCSAVTGACLMSRRSVFEELGGFDENLQVAFNDVDYCLRLKDAGYQVLYTPHAELIHHESASRGISGFYHDIRQMLRKWDSERFLNDPLYNPNLSLLGTWCGLRSPGEVAAWRRQMALLKEEKECSRPVE